MPMLADEEEPRAELTTYSCKDAVIYLPIPAASTVGHRAEFWNVDKPLQVKRQPSVCQVMQVLRMAA